MTYFFTSKATCIDYAEEYQAGTQCAQRMKGEAENKPSNGKHG